MITLFGFGPAFGLPDPSPFVMKTEIQLKMAGVPEDKVIMAAMREAAPDKPLRLDANEGWKTKEEALERLEWLAKDSKIQFVEQPMPARTNPIDLAWLKARSPLPLFGDESFEGRPAHLAFQAVRLHIQPADRVQLLVIAKLRGRDCRFEHADRLVEDARRHRIRMAVLAAMREREARRIDEAAGRAVHDLGHQGKSLNSARAHARREQQILEIGRPSFGRRSEIAVQAPHVDVAFAHVVMRRHDEIRQCELRIAVLHVGLRRFLDQGQFAKDTVRSERCQKIELPVARRLGAPVGQVDDLPLVPPLDGGMRRIEETGQPLR